MNGWSCSTLWVMRWCSAAFSWHRGNNSAACPTCQAYLTSGQPPSFNGRKASSAGIFATSL
ncbi:hypothetical protein MCHI_002869 [Candidatus Magnetoovum chiemensis]|nr:hypothetical protein MCHI_002869 [Candidatus Magnetoovum chiemensis]